MPAEKESAERSPVELDRVLQALRSRTRREILDLIWERELSAGDIAANFPLSAPTISQHLAVLRAAGLVQMVKSGTSRRYQARRSALAGMHGALQGAGKWQPVQDVPERALASAATRPVVVATVDLLTSQQETFTALTDPELYSRWLRSPVTIDEGRFAATLEWGIEVRGQYEIVVPPQLIVLRWDFDTGNIPVPGQPLIGYVRIAATAGGSTVTVHQLVESSEQASFMEGAWRMVLGRLRANLTRVLHDPGPAA